MQLALVPDSSAVDFDDIGGHGQRLVTACCDEHMAAMVAEARRKWRDDEWWFALLRKASTRPGARRATLTQIAERAGLSTEHLAAALAWNADRPEPSTALPGGQPITHCGASGSDDPSRPSRAPDLCAPSGSEGRRAGR